jgi:glutathione S-transferase
MDQRRATTTLFVIPGSHACATAMLMLAHKRIEYRVVRLPTGAHPLILRVLGFPGNARRASSLDGEANRMLAAVDRLGTVPALRIAGERVQTNIAIARRLERVQPEPPLFPSDPERRAAVEEAESWGDRVLQMAARRIVLAASATRGLDALSERGARGRLGALLSRSDTIRSQSSRGARHTFAATPAAEAGLLDELGAQLDRVDGWIDAGVLMSGEPTVADMTLAPSLALLAYRTDLHEQIEARPAGALMRWMLPDPAIASAGPRTIAPVAPAPQDAAVSDERDAQR